MDGEWATAVLWAIWQGTIMVCICLVVIIWQLGHILAALTQAGVGG
jgi:hypothetical protein